jgi:hypothetical protein
MRLRVQVQKEFFVDYPTKLAPEDFQEFMAGFLEWQCDKVRERIREVVKTQAYKWEPLSPNYVQFKERMGLSPKIWFASGQVMDSIIYWYDALGDQWLIGVHPTLRHRGYKKGGGLDWSKKGARIIDIIRWMEMGTTKMPARPLFTKVLAEFKKKSKQTALYAEYIKDQKGSLA